MERNSSGALRAPGAFGASGTSDPHAAISSWSLHVTHVCWLAAVLRPSAVVRVGPEVCRRCHLQTQCHQERGPGTPGAAPEAAEARSPAAHSTQALKWPGGLRDEPGGGCHSLSERERRAAGPILLQLDAILSELSQEAGALRNTDRFGVSDAAVPFSFP